MFGVTQDEVVAIERQGAGERCHLYPHADREQLIQNLYAGDKIEIDDATGVHVYPVHSVIGLHFGHVPNYTRAGVQLWQDNDGFGTLGQEGASALYLVDPADLESAWEIRSRVLRRGSRDRFRTLAAGLIEGTVIYGRVLKTRVPVAQLCRPEHIATWRHAGHSVEIIYRADARAGMDLPVAGPIARGFIGEEDLTPDDQD